MEDQPMSDTDRTETTETRGFGSVTAAMSMAAVYEMPYERAVARGLFADTPSNRASYAAMQKNYAEQHAAGAALDTMSDG
jgi:hypothetical protein